MKSQAPGCIIDEAASIDPSALIAPGCIIHGKNIRICAGARLDAGCIVGEDVVIGRNAWVRAGSVVLQSIPSNAIAEGNPALVVGYKGGVTVHEIAKLQRIDSRDLAGHSRPAKIPIGVGKSEIYLMRSISDSRGSLAVGEVPSELPFVPNRFFAIYGVPSVELRGEHAHKECEQFLLCVHGSCRVMVDDGTVRREVVLETPDVGVYMPSMLWGTQYRYSSDAVLLVFASHPYCSNDYIREYDEFLALIS